MTAVQNFDWKNIEKGDEHEKFMSGKVTRC